MKNQGNMAPKRIKIIFLYPKGIIYTVFMLKNSKYHFRKLNELQANKIQERQLNDIRENTVMKMRSLTKTEIVKNQTNSRTEE